MFTHSNLFSTQSAVIKEGPVFITAINYNKLISNKEIKLLCKTFHFQKHEIILVIHKKFFNLCIKRKSESSWRRLQRLKFTIEFQLKLGK